MCGINNIEFTDVCFITEDVLKLRAFYESVFGTEGEGDDIHSFIRLEGLIITFDSASIISGSSPFGQIPGGVKRNSCVGFNVSDVDAEYVRLRSLDVDVLSEPVTHPWGARSFQFRDPDGNILNFRTVINDTGL